MQKLNNLILSTKFQGMENYHPQFSSREGGGEFGTARKKASRNGENNGGLNFVTNKKELVVRILS